LSNILSTPPAGRRLDLAAALAYAAQRRGVSTLRIAVESALLARGRGGLPTEDYFLTGAWQPGLSWAERRAFLGAHRYVALNSALNPPAPGGPGTALQDKLDCHARFTAAGLPQPRILAVAAAGRPATGAEWLASPQATQDFLARPDALPCFGKPVHGSQSLGGVSILAPAGPGRVLLGNGREAGIADLAGEIWRDFPKGFLFQELIRPHPALAALTGPVIGSLRLATILPDAQPELLYAVLRGPAAGAMVDSSTGPLGSYIAVDVATGRVIRAQDRRQMGGVDLAKSNLTGADWPGAQLPDFGRAVEIALAAHAAFGEYGIVGSDIFLSDRGPLITEINGNPHHSPYQQAHARGILNPDFLPRLRVLRDRFRATVPRPKGSPLK
jgi:hypothetical protein